MNYAACADCMATKPGPNGLRFDHSPHCPQMQRRCPVCDGRGEYRQPIRPADKPTGFVKLEGAMAPLRTRWVGCMSCAGTGRDAL